MSFPSHNNYGFPTYTGVHSHPQIVFNPMINRLNQTQTAAKSHETTVFVGNITEKCPDEFVQKILKECGKVNLWKRIQGTNGKPQGFGFCTFDAPEGTMRALRILNDFQVGDKKLLVKVEEKIRAELRTHALANRKRLGKPLLQLREGELPADEDDLKRDEEVRLKILNWIETDHQDLLVIAEDGELSDKDSKKKVKGLRNISPNSTEEEEKRKRSESRERKSRRTRSPESPRRKRRRHSSSSSRSRSSNSSSSDSDSRSRSRSPKNSKDRRRRRGRSVSRSSEDSDDAHERREIKKQLKKKAADYKVRLNKWESRERMRAKLYQKADKKEKDRKKEQLKEARRLKTFLEDYDDEKDDQKYFKSSSLYQRTRDYEKEREADEKDRQREQQEIEEIKRQILEENKEKGSEAIEEEAKKRHKANEEAALKKFREESGSPNPHQPLGQVANQRRGSSSSSGSSGDEDEVKSERSRATPGQGAASASLSRETSERPFSVNSTSSPAGITIAPVKWKSFGTKFATTMNQVGTSPTTNSPAQSQLLAPLAPPQPPTIVPQQQNIAQRLNGVFGIDDEEDSLARKKKLTKIEMSKEERSSMLSAEEKEKLRKDLVKQIPSTKPELFVRKIDWEFLDESVMTRRIKPWIGKKITEYLGEDESSLVDFVIDKIKTRTPPDQILKDVALIIDDDAELFMIKLWRLLVFEASTRKEGIN